MDLDQFVRIVHFLGIAMGFSVSFSGIMLGPLMARATPEEARVLSAVPARMSKLGSVGLVLIWLSGIYLIRPIWTDIGEMEWQLQAKLASVVLLTAAVGTIHILERGAAKGSDRARRRLPIFGKIATVCALSALVFAVLAFR
ncbi:MAG: hypothetical protein HONBIEJF_02001 [Fimbriimonadaceae bacterium]|nr:hypothetical protein [Fimbriimonadaceae bacterium]